MRDGNVIDPQSRAALAAAVRRALLADIQRAVAGGLMPTVIGIHRSRDGIVVQLRLRDGVHVERDVVLDGRVFDLRTGLDVIEDAIRCLVALAARPRAAVGRAPITVGSRP